LVILVSALGLAFYDYGGQHVEQIVLSAIGSLSKPKKRVWAKETPQNQSAQKEAEAEINEIPVVAPKQDILSARGRIADMARNIDASSQAADPDDVFQKSKPENPLEALLKKAKPAEAKNPVVSQMASVSPSKQFDYPKIEKAVENPLEELKQK
jgi:hypothetical protein